MTVQEAIDHLCKSFGSGRPASGYIIAGSLRTSAREVVEAVMSYLFCEADDRPCGECRGCRAAQEHTYADLLWIEPQKASRIISIEQVRDLRARMFQTSLAGGWKVCVLAGADRLKAAAANAFLKILEEPPGKTVFFLLTEKPQFLLPTIRSRCQRVNVSGESERIPNEWREVIIRAVTALRNGEPVSAFACSDSIVGMLREIKSEAADEEKEAATEEVTDEDTDTVKARASARYREKRQAVMTFILKWYRDVLMAYCGADNGALHNRDEADAIRRHADALAYREALRNISVVEEMNRELEANLPEHIVFGQGFSQLR